MLGQTALPEEKRPLSFQLEVAPAALSDNVVSRSKVRFLWTGFGFAVLTLIAVSASWHASTKPSGSVSAVAFAPSLPGLSAGGTRPSRSIKLLSAVPPPMPQSHFAHFRKGRPGEEVPGTNGYLSRRGPGRRTRPLSLEMPKGPGKEIRGTSGYMYPSRRGPGRREDSLSPEQLMKQAVMSVDEDRDAAKRDTGDEVPGTSGYYSRLGPGRREGSLSPEQSLKRAVWAVDEDRDAAKGPGEEILGTSGYLSRLYSGRGPGRREGSLSTEQLLKRAGMSVDENRDARKGEEVPGTSGYFSRRGPGCRTRVLMSADLQSDDRTNQRLLEAFDAEHGCAFFTKPVVKRFLDDVSKELQYHQSEPTSNQLHDVDSKSSRDKRKTLVLDLDETLITSTKELPQGEGLHAPEQKPELLNYMHQNNKRLTGEKPELLLERLCPGEDWTSPRGLYVFKRPGLDKFLQEVTLLYNVAIFTAASPEYADPILDALEKTVPRASHAADDTDNSALFSRRLYADDMRYPGQGDPRRLGGGGKIKDLAILGKPLQDVVMVDDRPKRVVQIKNTIPIEYWSAATYMLHDQELLDLLPILRKLAVVDDVRDMWPQVLENDLPAVDDDLPADASADMPTTNMVDYSANTVVQLRDVLRSRGLTLGGKKAELVARLQDDDSTPANAPASTRY